MTYAQASKMFIEGQLAGAVRTGEGRGARVSVPESLVPPSYDPIKCMICGKPVSQITYTHLRVHGITLADYKARFPHADIVSSEVSRSISESISGTVRTEEHKQNISKGRTGVIPQNHPRYVIGAHTASEETKQKMREAHTGLKHTEEAKQKIGDRHRGKIIPQESIEKTRLGLQQYYENNDSAFKGKSHTEDTKNQIRVNTTRYWDNYTDEQRSAHANAIGDGARGLTRTDEQKQTYREARVKFMSENPHKTKDTTGEQSIKTWLEARNIQYVQQFVIDGWWHPYDFYLPEHRTIIEFDGSHHWHNYWFNILGKTKQERETMLVEQFEKDAINNLVAGRAGYRIIRIRGHADVGDSIHGSLEEQLVLQCPDFWSL